MDTDTSPRRTQAAPRPAEARPASQPAESPRLLPLLGELPELRPLTACLGEAESEQPLLLRLPSAVGRHLLVTGGAGCGKTELLRTLVVSLALTNRQAQLQLALLEPGSGGFLPLDSLPHNLAGGVASSPVAALAGLHQVARQAERRWLEGFAWPHLVVAIDDLAALLEAGGEPLEQMLLRLSRHARETGVHLLAAVRDPGDVPAALLGCFAAQCHSQSGAAPGTFELRAGRQQVAFRAAWIPAHDWAELVDSG